MYGTPGALRQDHGPGPMAGIKKPQPRAIGGSQHRADTFPSKGFVRQSESQAGVLARGLSLLSAPSRGSRLSGLRRFRSAYSCGAALALHQLPYSQVVPVSP